MHVDSHQVRMRPVCARLRLFCAGDERAGGMPKTGFLIQKCSFEPAGGERWGFAPWGFPRHQVRLALYRFPAYPLVLAGGFWRLGSDEGASRQLGAAVPSACPQHAPVAVPAGRLLNLIIGGVGGAEEREHGEELAGGAAEGEVGGVGVSCDTGEVGARVSRTTMPDDARGEYARGGSVAEITPGHRRLIASGMLEASAGGG